MPISALDIARTYLARGWTPVPVFHQDKKPTIPKGWPTLRYVDESAAWLEGSVPVESGLETLFGGQRNIGVVLGAASGGLVDIDLDCPEAVRLAPRLLPPTGAIFGRPSSLRAHWLYVAPGAETKKWAGMPYTNGDGKTRIPTLIELRSTGGQTVFPGSTHVSGELIAWAEEGEPAIVDADELREAALRVAVASLMVRSAGFTDDEAVLFVQDEAAVRSLGGELGKVLRPWLGIVPTPAAKKKTRRPEEGSDDFQEAVDRYNADHARDYGQDGANECPMCGYHRGFGRLRGTGRWSCFAAPHVSNGGPGIKSATGDSYHGDALDIGAHEAGLTRDKLLVRDGYLRPPRQKAPKATRTSGPMPLEDAPLWVPGEEEGAYEEPVVRQALDTLPPTRAWRRGRVQVSQDAMAETVNAGVSALMAADVHLYQRERRLVRVVRDNAGGKRKWLQRPTGTPVILEAIFPWLQEQLSRAASWLTFDKRSKENVPVLPPEWVVKTLMARGEWDFPPLEGIIESPCLRPDGTVLDTAGYDPATGLLYEPGSATFLPVADAPSLADAKAAIGELKEPFADFPFVAESDRTGALAATLTVIARFAVVGCVPLMPVTATARRTGKSKLVDVISVLATGRSAARMTQIVNNHEEEQKTYLALCMEGDPLILIDNCTSALGSAALDALLTAPVFKARVLGVTKTTSAPNNAVWFATGNNLEYRSDTPGRIMPIRLEASQENPEERTGFAHPDLLAWVLAERPRLVRAALTILRAYHVAGRPSQKVSAFGSFEAWSALIREALVWAGEPDPLTDRKAITEASDGALDDLRALLMAWRDAFGAEKRSVRDAMEWAIDAPHADHQGAKRQALRDPFAAIDPRFDGEKVTPGMCKKVGQRLKREQGRIVGGLRFKSELDAHTKMQTWGVAQVGAGSTASAGSSDSAGFAGFCGVPTVTTQGSGRDVDRSGTDTSQGKAGKNPAQPRNPAKTTLKLVVEEEVI